MSERGPTGHPEPTYPPDWVEEATRLGDSSLPDIWATTAWGVVYVAIWRAFRDETPFERDWAMTRAPGVDWPPQPSDAVARVRALREARRQRPDWSDATWQEVLGVVAPNLSEGGRQDPGAILAAVQRRIDATIELFEPALEADRRAHTPPAESHGLTGRMIRQAAAAIRRERDGQPTQNEVAERLHTSPATLKRAMVGLKMARWPPAPPED